MDKKSILADTKKLKAIVADATATSISSIRLNETLHKTVFMQLLDHIIAALEE